MKAHDDLRCPVCKASFRSQTTCSRCGADLSKLMCLVAGAYHLRTRAHQALTQHRYQEAHELAQQAEALHSTAIGRKLALTSGAMAMIVVTAKDA
jgi:predicted amidophosphoribosyltransferase